MEFVEHKVIKVVMHPIDVELIAETHRLIDALESKCGITFPDQKLADILVSLSQNFSKLRNYIEMKDIEPFSKLFSEYYGKGLQDGITLAELTDHN